MTANDQHLVVLTKFVAAREEKPRAALFALKSAAQALLPGNRIAICYHHRLPEREFVHLYYSPERESAYYRGLMKCGQGWVCPVCAQRLAIVRRDALKLAIDNTRDKFLPLMVTYTTSHRKGQPLSFLLGAMASAYRDMRMQRIWRTYKEEYLIRGETRALEITWGDNGWHPHYHVVLWLDVAILKAIEEEDGTYPIWLLRSALQNHLFSLWEKSLAKFNLTALYGIGVDVASTDEELNQYLTKQGSILPKDARKWGIAEEMTLQSRKENRADGKTPWELLIEHFCGFPSSGALFAEYAEGTKGKSALQWTPGLKEQCGLALDEEAETTGEEQNIDEILMAEFGLEQWRKIVETDAVGFVQDAAGSGDPEKLERALQRVEERARETKLHIPD